MRLPFRTETDAFRVVVALALLTAPAVLVGWTVSRPYGPSCSPRESPRA